MPRFTAGMMDLQSGFGFITLAMAMFALPEAIFLVQGMTANLLSALIALNVTPGPRLMIDEPADFLAVIMSMFIAIWCC